MALDRIVSPAHQPADLPQEPLERSLRPESLEAYIGQPRLVEKLRIAITAARQRGEPMEHTLLHGPPGLGKTTIAHVIAREMGAQLHVTSGPVLTKASDLVGILTRLQGGDVLFIDEIHRLPAAVEEYIYPAMEDFKIDVSVDSGMHARSITLRLKPFCLIGATTRTGLLSGPLRSRFGISHHLDYYGQDDLFEIVRRSASLLEIRPEPAPEPLTELARRSRGTPRIVNRLLRRVRDYAQVHHDGALSPACVAAALDLEGVDHLGLDDLDRSYLRTIARTFSGGPVGLEAVAATMGQDVGTLEDVVEPYLLQIGLVARTRRGRCLTREGAAHIGETLADDSNLFE